MMEKKGIRSNPARTVLTVCTGILVIYIISGKDWLLYIAVIIGAAGVFSSYASTIIESLWMKLARLLGLIIPVILLSLVFFLVVFPISVLSKLFSGRDNLALKNRNKTLLVGTGREFTKADFERPW